MTTTEKDLDVRRISPESIIPDPENPRGKLRDLDALTASVKIYGVLEPITVRSDPTANGSGPRWIVVRGHRRHAAALKAKVDLVPCVVDWSDDAKARAQTRMVENLQRDDLTATEQAKGVQQLLDLGLTEEEVATGLSVSTDHVQRATRIQASKVLAKAPASLELSFDDAAAVAEFEDSPKLAKGLLGTLQKEPEYFAQELEQARQNRAEQALIDEKTAELKAAGFKILKSKPRGYSDMPDYGTKEKPIRYLRADAAAKGALTSVAHKGCAGRCAHVEVNQAGKVEVTEACADWKANGHVYGSARSSSSSSTPGKPAAELTPAQKKAKEKETQERRIHLACIKAGRAAEVVRREFVARLLAANTVPKSTMAFVVPELVTEHCDHDDRIVEQLLGSDGKPKARKVGDLDVEEEWLASLKEPQLPLALLAWVASHNESKWDPNSWNHGYWKDQRLRYLRFLVSCGYTPSLVEKVQLGQAKPAEVLAEAERIKEAARA